MAISATIGIEVDGAKDAANELRKVSGEISKTTGAANERRTLRFRQSLAALSRQERQEAFARLSTEDKLTKLTERRAFLERQMLRAQQQGNAYRAGALRLSMANVSGQMAGLGPTGLTKYLSMAGSGVRGFASGIGFPMMAGGGALGIGVAVGMLVKALERSVFNASAMADNLEDMADMIGLDPGKVSALQKSGFAAGVPGRMVYSAVGTLRSKMEAALSGDATALARFERYGVSREMLRGGDVIAVGQRINERLAGGTEPGHEADVKAFLGQRGRMGLKLFAGVREPGVTSDQIRKAATLQAAREQVEAEFNDTSIRLGVGGKYWQQLMNNAEQMIPGRIWYLSRQRMQQNEREQEVRRVLGLRGQGFMGQGPSGAPQTPVAPFDESSMKPGAEPSPMSGRPTIDALMRIGLFRGGVEARQLGLLRDQVNKLNDIVAQLKTLNREVSAE